MYAPQLGRFISRDPAGYVDGVSLYEALQSSPTVKLDPSGLDSNTDQYGQYWDPNVDWLHYPSRRPDGFIPGMGYPPGDPRYDTRPDLGAMVKATCKPVVRGCKACQDTRDREIGELLLRVGRGPLGKGIAGAGIGIAVGFIIKGGTKIAAATLEGSEWGPIGTIGGAAVGIGGTIAAGIDYHTKWSEYHSQADEINRVYNDCMDNCDPRK
jgi:hypothetical protein